MVLAMGHVRNCFRLIDGHNHIYGLSDGPCPQFCLIDGQNHIYGLSDGPSPQSYVT